MGRFRPGMAVEPFAGMDASYCPSCRMVVGGGAAQVMATAGLFHRECFEAWYFARHAARPRLRRAPSGRHCYTVRGAAGAPTASV
jgi:hypothetical protein